MAISADSGLRRSEHYVRYRLSVARCTRWGVETRRPAASITECRERKVVEACLKVGITARDVLGYPGARKTAGHRAGKRQNRTHARPWDRMQAGLNRTRSIQATMPQEVSSQAGNLALMTKRMGIGAQAAAKYGF
jgi:hypothetical protein